MATPRTIVKAAVESITDGPAFMWGIPSDFNKRLDDLANDTAVLMLPVEGKKPESESMQLNKIPMQYVCSMGIVKRTKFDDDYNDTRALVLEEMTALALDVLARVKATVINIQMVELGDYYINEMSRFDMEGLGAYFNQFDVNCDGVQLTFELMLTIKSATCWEGSGKIEINL